jgi:hypothetical protein
VYQSSDRNKFLSIKPLNIARLFLSLPRTIKVGFCYGCQSMGSRYYLKFLVYSLFSFTHFKAQSCRKKFFCIQYIWTIYLWFWGCNPQISTKFCKTLSLNSSEILLCRRQLVFDIIAFHCLPIAHYKSLHINLRWLDMCVESLANSLYLLLHFRVPSHSLSQLMVPAC